MLPFHLGGAPPPPGRGAPLPERVDRWCLLSIWEGWQEVLTPDVMHVIETAHLREEASERLIVALAEGDSSGPVVAPLDHGARLEKQEGRARAWRELINDSVM